MNSGLCDGIRLGNSSSDSHSPGYSASSNGAVGMSDSSAITNSDISYRDELNHKVVLICRMEPIGLGEVEAEITEIKPVRILFMAKSLRIAIP